MILKQEDILCALLANHTQIQDRQRRGGFTLIEVLLVVMIIGVLAAVVMPR